MKRLALLLIAAARRLRAAAAAAGARDSVAPQLLADRMIMNDGAALPLRQWQPAGEPKAVILALHGFNDYSYLVRRAGESLGRGRHRHLRL